MSRHLLAAAAACALTPQLRAESDVVVYGATAGGVAAAVQAARMGKSVLLVEPTRHVGGLTSGGLGYTDSGNKAVIGGIAREFYQRVKKHYDDPAAWPFGKREVFPGYRPNEDAMWVFEPHVAEKILREMLAEHKIEVIFGERIDRKRGAELDGKRLRLFRTESGKVVEGKVFIDATYEGDLMAAAGVSYAVGREPNARYGESLNGVARKWNTHTHRFTHRVDPFVRPGDRASGYLFGIDPGPYPADGEGDRRIQAYCYRMCMSNVPENRVPFPRPDGYVEAWYELLLRNFEAGDMRLPLKIDMMPNGTTDTNNNYAVSTDFIGMNYDYPEGDHATRERIAKQHEVYQKGLMWTLANHPRVPESIRDKMKVWGLAKREFTDSGNWPHQLYVREARRMVSDHVMTEADCRRLRDTPQTVGMGSYNMDSHNCMRWVTPDGVVQNEGDVQVSPGGPYRISYKSIVPKAGECTNLLVPVCVASSHIAYGSIRMEPVFMVLGQSAATGGVLALETGSDVQTVPYDRLRTRLVADKQVLEFAAPPAAGGIDPKKLIGVVVDDEQAERVGFETVSTSIGPFVGTGYRHDGNVNRGKQTARFVPNLPEAGRYKVQIAYTANANRATNAPVTLVHADGTTEVRVNMRRPPTVSVLFVEVGTYRFEAGRRGSVTIGNADADGYVIADAVVFLPVKD